MQGKGRSCWAGVRLYTLDKHSAFIKTKGKVAVRDGYYPRDQRQETCCTEHCANTLVGAVHVNKLGPASCTGFLKSENFGVY